MLKKFTVLAALILTTICVQNAIAAPECIMTSKIGEQLCLPIYEWIDSRKPRQGIIVAVPALTLYAQSWDNIAKHLASKGYQVFALEMRGSGRWLKESSKFGGNENIDYGQSQLDLLDLVTTLHLAHPDQKLFCLGESIGSNIILLLLSEHSDLATGAILIAPGYKSRIHAQTNWLTDFAIQVVEPGKPVGLEPYTAKYWTNKPALAEVWCVDPMICHRMTVSDLISVHNLNSQGIAAARNIPKNFPLLIIAGLDDAIFKSAELPEAVKTFGTDNVSLNILPGKGHILLEHQVVDPQIALLIDRWLDQQSAQVKSSLTKIQTKKPLP